MTKITTKIKGKDVVITLTDEQLEEIESQTEKRISIKNLTPLVAEKLLSEHGIKADPKGLYKGAMLELITIIRATNFIDNNYKDWEPDFNNSSIYKYYGWFEKKVSGWAVSAVNFQCCGSHCLAGLCYKEEKSCDFIIRKWLPLYSEIL